MQCLGCGNTKLIVINLNVGENPLTLHRCAACDVRAWVGPDGEVGLDRVLDLARVPR